MKQIYHKVKQKYRSKYINMKWRPSHTIGLFFISFFLLLIGTLFKYTILEHEVYKAKADKQQKGTTIMPVNRGTIKFGGGREAIVGTSLNQYDLSIDPLVIRDEKVIGNKEKLSQYLTDLVYEELCEKKGSETCAKNLRKFLKQKKIEKYNYDNKEALLKIIAEGVDKKIYQEKVTSVLIDKEFSELEIEKIKELRISGVYPKEKVVYLNPEEFYQTPENIASLSQALGLDYQSVEKLTKKRARRYVPFLKKLSVPVSEKLKEYIENERIAAHTYEKNGDIKEPVLAMEDSIYNFIILEPNPNRYYPDGNIGAQIIGFLGSDGKGQYGIEKYFDGLLQGDSEAMVIKTDVKGRPLNVISKKGDLMSEGVTVVSTIDRNVQKKMEEIIQSGVHRFRANRGTIVVTEPTTGKVLSMASYPSYDLNNYSDVFELEEITEEKYPNPKDDLRGLDIFVEDTASGTLQLRYGEDKLDLRKATKEEVEDVTIVKYKYVNNFGAGVYQNPAISMLYEPGSIMKSVVMAMGLDASEILPTTMYNDVNKMKIDGFPIENTSYELCGGYQSMQNALSWSCNIGMVNVIRRLGRPLAYQYFTDFGFSELSGIELSGEVNFMLPHWKQWAPSEFYTKSYGLGISVTPLQMAAAYNVLANGGVYMKPKIIEEIIYPDGRKFVFKDEPKRRVIKESTSKTISKMLYSSAEKGFADTGKVEGYSLAGKTGTAQIAGKGGYETGIGATFASYAGYGPIEDPRFVIIVQLERPKSNQTGSKTSAYLFKEAATYLLDYYEIPKKEINRPGR